MSNDFTQSTMLDIMGLLDMMFLMTDGRNQSEQEMTADEHGPQRVWRMVGPSAIIGGSLLIALAIYFDFLGGGWVRIVAEWTARWTSAALNLLGSSTSVDGTIVASDSFAVNIVTECTSLGPLVLFIGAVVAYPSAFKSRGTGVLLGIAVLTAVNLVRIVSLFWIGSTFPQYLSVAHLLVWQSVMILLAIVLWLFWVERVARVRHA